VKILGVETSCDETAAAVVSNGTEILSNVVSSQVDLHRPYGGVVPELASRNHLHLIDSVVEEALCDAHTSIDEIDGVAATYGPGLASSLLIGLNAAKGIAFAAGKPFVAINHVEAHLYSPLFANAALEALPMVSLVVSGGHTILAHTTAIGTHEILGQTVDDAAGEAFDKVAKLLNLGYPGGPEIQKRAESGNPKAIDFPRGMLHEGGYDFSFSGLKTSVLYFLRKKPRSCVEDVCASFQEAVVDVLVGKTIRAAADLHVKAVSASGGVSVNRRFREKLGAECTQLGLQLLLAPAVLCTDNAAMIASLAYYQLSRNGPSNFSLEIAPSIGLGAGGFSCQHA
jgi:N6-L-threonylcarbamoyladenine synthase